MHNMLPELFAQCEPLGDVPYAHGYLLGLCRLVGDVSDPDHAGYLRTARGGQHEFERGYRDALAQRQPDPSNRVATLSVGGRPSRHGPGSRTLSLRVSLDEYAAYDRLGGSDWLRGQLRAAPGEPD